MRWVGPIALLWAATACAGSRPRWVEHVPRGYEYEYVVGLGSDSSRAAARQGAVATAMARMAEQKAVRLTVSRLDTITREERLDAHGARQGRFTQRYRGTLAIASETPELETHDLSVVDEFWSQSRGQSDVWVLMSRPRADGGRAAPGAASLALRSALVPGWGQLVKEQPRRGATILGMVAVAIPTAVLLGAMGSDAALRARRAETTPVRTFWRDRANTLGVARTGALGVAGAAYIYGITDAAARRPHDFRARATPWSRSAAPFFAPQPR